MPTEMQTIAAWFMIVQMGRKDSGELRSGLFRLQFDSALAVARVMLNSEGTAIWPSRLQHTTSPHVTCDTVTVQHSQIYIERKDQKDTRYSLVRKAVCVWGGSIKFPAWMANTTVRIKEIAVQEKRSAVLWDSMNGILSVRSHLLKTPT